MRCCTGSIEPRRQWCRIMHLDVPSLMVMQSFAMACAGAVLFFAWWQDRRMAELLLWALADMLAAGGILSLLTARLTAQSTWSVLGEALLTFQLSIMWKTARRIDGGAAPLPFVLAGPIIVGLAGGLIGTRAAAGSVSLAISALYSLAVAITLWLGRDDGLAARWPLIILAVIHAAIMSVGVYSTLNGNAADGVPLLTSLFGVVFFESIVFTVGTSVFVLALVKERSEASSIAAARIDSLTGIANRAAFLKDASDIFGRCKRESRPMSVMMFDLDRFKAINDRHGHALGDDVIQQFCTVVRAGIRSCDLFGRLGGEEFAVVLPGSGVEAAFARAERICVSFAESCRFVRGRQIDATVSCGITLGGQDDKALELLLEEADGALYAAKIDGRNRVKRAGQQLPQDRKSNVFRLA